MSKIDKDNDLSLNEIGVQVDTIRVRKTRSNSTQSHGSTKQVVYGGKVKKRKYKDAAAQTQRNEISQ